MSFALVLFFAAAAHAELTPEQDLRARAIDSQVLSPFCPGRMLPDCPSGSAAELRRSIRAKIAQGASDAQIWDELLAAYGEGVRAAPTARGIGAAAWLAPALFFLLGASLLAGWLRSRALRRPAAESPAPEPADLTAADPQLAARIEDELRKL